MLSGIYVLKLWDIIDKHYNCRARIGETFGEMFFPLPQEKKPQSDFKVHRAGHHLPTYRSDKANFFEYCVRPTMRGEFYPGLTVSSFLNKALELYRDGKSHTLAIIEFWEKIDWVIPFTSDEYEEFVEHLGQDLAKEPNPSAQEDWDYMKTG